MGDTTGQADLRAEVVDSVVKGFALQEYRLKQVCTVSRANGWIESYYQEDSTELTAMGVGSTIRGVPRLAAFPHGEPNWTKQSSYIDKYGMEGIVSWEDALLDNIDVVARTLLRIARAVAKSVDDQIYSVISATASSILSGASTAAWDASTYTNVDIALDVARGKEAIGEFNYNVDGNSFILLSPHDYASLQAWTYSKGAQAPRIAEEILGNGRVGTYMGLKVVVSNSVTADQALIIVGGEAATWKEAVPLTTVTIPDAGIKYTIRSFELGVTQLTNPKAVYKITNTQT